MTGAPEIRVLQDPDELAREAADLIGWLVGQAIEKSGLARICLTGGSTPRTCYETLARSYADQLDWRSVEFYFGDERAVPPDHHASNYAMANEALFRPLGLAPEQILRMRGELDPEEAARQYEQVLRERFGPGVPRFPLLLLGLGEDGHVASLFPGTPGLAESQRLVFATVSPKPPHPRITLTIPVLNNAEVVLFLVSGRSKAKAVQRTLEAVKPDPQVPATLVRPVNGRLIWLLDRHAAADLTVARQGIVSHEE